MTDLVTLMRHDEIPACLRVIAEGWNPLVAQQAQDDLRDMFLGQRFAPTFYVTRHRDIPVGISGYVTSWKNWGILDLIYTAVLPAHRGLGLGKRLVERCLQDADNFDCAVMLTTYVPAFYRRLEFETMDEDLLCAGRVNTLMLRRCLTQREALATGGVR